MARPASGDAAAGSWSRCRAAGAAVPGRRCAAWSCRPRPVGEMIDALDARWPGMRDRLCDSTPRIRRHINVFVEGGRATLETRLAPGAEVIVITAISGGPKQNSKTED